MISKLNNLTALKIDSLKYLNDKFRKEPLDVRARKAEKNDNEIACAVATSII
jgi:hypothetical protein